MLYNAIEQAPSAELVEPDFLTRYFATFDEQFFHYCDKELAKINTFYSGLYKKSIDYVGGKCITTNRIFHCREIG